jgi:hypothetical protein
LKSSFRVPFIKDSEIEDKAKEILKKFNPESIIPVPIENIIEFDLGINVVPVHGLYKAFEIDGFTSQDFSEITVDLGFFESVPKRYRFTLAHELGHYVLHKGILTQFQFKNIKDWFAFINSIPDKEYGFLETQANKFAGFLLVPSTALTQSFRKAIKMVEKMGIDYKELSDVALYFIYEELSAIFQVSPECIRIRIEKEKLDL